MLRPPMIELAHRPLGREPVITEHSVAVLVVTPHLLADAPLGPFTPH